MKERKERYFARLVIFAVAAVLIISSVAIMAYTADKEKPKLTTSFKRDVIPASTPGTPSFKSTDPIIWNNGGTSSVSTLFSSQNDAMYPFVSQMADDFQFATDMLVTDVHWWGGFWGGTAFDPCDFYIYFYADDGTGNAPTGGGMGDPAPTALATYHFVGVSGLPLDPNGFYEYDVDLSPPFSAAAGVKYWVAIQADFPYPPQWGWTNTSGIQLHNAAQGFPFLGIPFWTDPDPDLVDMAYYLTGLPDEEEWPNHKMHFPQLPDEIGWDVNATYPKILADDWQCSETGYVTDIHFWGSWKDTDGDPWTDDAGHILYFIFSIHSNIPADSDTPWSRPGELLWERIDSTAITPIDPPTLEGWYDPNTDLTFYNDHVPYWRYDYVDIPDPFFQYQDSIYWLNISAVLEDTFYHWGWKNSRDHFMDDAVYTDDTPGTPVPWIEMYEPPRANWFDVYFNSTGEPEDMGSTNHYGDGWYFYPLYNWWNMWFYDNPFVYNPKHIWLEFNVDPVGTNPYAEFAINWSTDLWSLEGVPDRPPLPGENEDLYIGRQQFEVVPGPNTIDFWINDYNPEWVSIDFRAQDVVINGWIWHECVRTSMDLAFVITGGDVPPPEEDFGDCPDAPYPTQLASNGARHTIVPGVFMGAAIDPEPNGQQSPDTLGDDNDGNDDEDGVVFTTLAVAGNPATVKVTAPVAGFLDAWVDFDADGDWADAGENIFASVAVAPGVSFLTFTVPAVATAGITYSRFRFSTAGGLTYTGPAPDGEVEDYRVFILQPIQDDKMHWPQLPDLDNTGMDVDMYEFPLADDFLCIETGKILDAHIWGSFADDILPAGGPGALTFQVEIWSDVTAADNPYGPWSMPWELLCAYTFVPGEYDAYQVGDNNPEDWFDPVTGIWMDDNHLNVYQYDFYFDEAIACTQDSGTIYWLVVQDLSAPTDYIIGWKTTEFHRRFMDDACYWAPAGSWMPMFYPPGHEYYLPPPQEETLDLAFVITGKPTVKCGDVNNDGIINVGDVVYLIQYLYRGGPVPIPRICVGDVNNNDIVDVGDLVYLVTYLYKGGPAPDPDCCNPPWGK
ncbi:MAG: dockerin type I repeat-containing protein [Candidatus Zixiibacteriota bacterium]